MQIVINNCFGGFSLSPYALQRFAELKGKQCFFFTQEIKAGLESPYIMVTPEEAKEAFMFYAFTVSNPNKILKSKPWNEMTMKERQKHNKLYDSISISIRPNKRNDPDLVKCIEELGEKANGKCAELKIVKIPNNVKWEIDEYDGLESIHEVHRSWS
jgi:hypothetical protein